MSKLFLKKCPLILSCLGSLLLHVVMAHAVGVLGHYDFGRPVDQQPAVALELSDTLEARVAPVASADSASRPSPEPPATADTPADTPSEVRSVAALHDPAVPGLWPPSSSPGSEPASAAAEAAAVSPSPVADQEASADPAPPASALPSAEAASAPAPADTPAPVALQQPSATPAPAASQAPDTMLQKVSDFLAPRYERLAYQITMHGVPIGHAELESKNEKGITSITLRVRSNAAFSGIYLVEDLVETQHVGGLYIMARVSQREGSFTSEENFTINLRKKRVSWFDLKQPRSLTISVPTGNVLDSLSGIYYLRNRPLQVGTVETLYIFDSESYAEVPVEVLRREKMSLANLRKVDTLVVRPLQKTAGIFRRTGEVLIWLTDDASRVPVKIETSIALGKVTARLVSAESSPYQLP
ncbi:DUF3108 domain-containing protein [Geomonas sp.]|uniref:DUF3108 domain-containing protein n=1 Tax=Geomonas sp. TaxID=2651584 RepID=UPI002B4A3B26|nr:DUF3108 domain-containing protein [Geomonas sp.]HJV35706.1 DUF3108 domain-containing protein [Geomonas sp.]